MYLVLTYFVTLAAAFPSDDWLNKTSDKNVASQTQKEVMTELIRTEFFRRSPRTPFRGKVATPVNETELLQVEMTSFHKTLLNLIRDSHFDHELFITMVDDLGERLQTLISLTKGMISPNPMALKQVSFLLLMFEKMKFGASVIRFYSKRTPKESHWIKIMVQINVILFTFYDSFGNLSLQDARVREKLFSIWRDIQILSKGFEGLFGASDSAKNFFGEQLSQANEACLTLLDRLLCSEDERRNT